MPEHDAITRGRRRIVGLPADVDSAPIPQRGGLGKAWQLFGEELKPLLDELNRELVA